MYAVGAVWQRMRYEYDLVYSVYNTPNDVEHQTPTLSKGL